MDRQAVDASPPDLLDTAAAGPAAIRGSTWRILGYLVGLLLGVASSALMYRHLGRVATGKFNLATSLVAVVAGLSDLGLTAVGVRELAVRERSARDRMARSLLGLRIVTSTVGVIGVAAFAAGVGYGTTLVIGVVCAGVGLVLLSCQSTLAISLIVDMRPAWVAGFDFVRVALTAALVVALVALGAHLLAFLAVSIPVGIVVLALNARVVRGRMPLRPAFRAGEWWTVLRGAIPYTLATAAATLYTQVAVIAVSLLASADALGYFSLSARAVQMLLVLPGLAVGSALPIFARAARDDRARLAYALGRTFEVSLLLGVWSALVVAIGAPIAVTVYGPQFTRSVSLLAIQGTGLGASFVGAVWSTGLLSLGRYRSILVINLLAASIGSVLIVVLTSIDGAHGAAIATASWEGASALLCGVALFRSDRLLAPRWGVVPRVAAAAGLGAATTAIPLPVLVSVALASVVYAIAAIGLGAVPAEIYAELRRVRRSVL